MDFIITWVIPLVATLALGYVVYQQYLEQGRKYERKQADKKAMSEASAS